MGASQSALLEHPWKELGESPRTDLSLEEGCYGWWICLES
jgi:hypothetical protein